MSGFRKGFYICTCSKESFVVRLGFWEAGFGLLFGATFSSRLCCLRASFSPLSVPGGSGEVARKKTILMKTKDRACSWSWDKKKQWKSLRLQFAQPRRPAPSYQQGTPDRWSWRLAFETSRTKASEDREIKGWTFIWRENFQFGKY